MKIAVTSLGPTLDSHVDPKFGRCAYFIIIDPDTMDFEYINNHNAQNGGGSGIQSGQLMSEKNVGVVLTGNVGPNAFETLNAADIKVMTGVTGSIREAVLNFKKGHLKSTSQPTVDSHTGTR